MHIGIAGAGLLGRLFAFRLASHHHEITLFDQDDLSGHESCGMTAAGMLAPYAEITAGTNEIVKLGLASIDLWPQYLQTLKASHLLSLTGTLLIAHHRDRPELQRFLAELAFKLSGAYAVNALDTAALQALEPELSCDGRAYHILNEGYIDNVALFAVLKTWLLAHPKVTWHPNTPVDQVGESRIAAGEQTHTFDWVIDCRGLGASAVFPALRAVRGEVITVHAPAVRLMHVVRLMHPRYPLYIVPRPNQHYIIGATEIEVADWSPVSVRSALTLLSALSTVHAGFLEARITDLQTNCRPTLPDNLPVLQWSSGCVAVNGLYRHGFLIAPALVEQVVTQLQQEIQHDYRMA